MQDEIRSLESRLRKLQAEILAATRDQTGVCRRFVGKVYNVGTLPASGDRYFLTHPVTLAGNETENTTPTIVVNTSISTPVLIIGPAPAVNDYVIANLIERTWIAERWYISGGSGLTINIPNCVCTAIPVSGLSLTVTYNSPATAATYGHQYQDCTLAYYDNAAYGIPPYGNSFATSSFPGPAFYSTTSWINDSGFENYFRLSCFFSQFALGIGEGAVGMWQAPAQIYNWGFGGKPAVNFCSPFLLAVGSVQPGVTFNGKFVVSGP